QHPVVPDDVRQLASRRELPVLQQPAAVHERGPAPANCLGLEVVGASTNVRTVVGSAVGLVPDPADQRCGQSLGQIAYHVPDNAGLSLQYLRVEQQTL